MNENALQASGITVRYGKRVAVDNASLTVPRGAVYALLGRNGAGKSSLVRCLLGQQKPQAGSITLFGEDVWKHRASLMERVGVVSEEADAPPQMRVAELSRFCGRLYSRWSQEAVDQRLRRFGIDAHARFGDLSKGQKKQVGLALALANSPELLILDDPTLGLDVVARKSLFEEVISELADRGITVVLTTHDLAGVEAIADRIAIMSEGRVVLEEELEVVKARFRRIRYAQRPVAVESGAIAMRSWGSSGAEAIVSDYQESPERFQAAQIEALSLEEIFIAVVGDQS
ncbi:MAG TPA: ABC transporter ATP-binding protein [Thermoanaerobaculia bacterium]|nr:ABC transporter ATP-binding protein [Thermoanaerobaculia bacterium]